MEQSGSTATAGSGQMQQAGPSEAAAGERCPICLGTTRNTAYTYTCFHAFCFRCIRRWAATISACPLCRQPIDRILHTVRADDDYQQYVCRPSAHGRRNAARERVRSRSPQRRYNLRPRPTNNGPAAGRRGPISFPITIPLNKLSLSQPISCFFPLLLPLLFLVR
uniref:RING-type E3 ubiquitin transferase n=1 Tax=Anas platyrhynchos TaxID=8839 RepID=A0A8B9R1S7_ANAPL